jgi:hypothetical protein
LIREGNLLEVDWSCADVAFASSLCFSDDLINSLLKAAAKLKLGAKLLTLSHSHSLNIPAYLKLRASHVCKMSWGNTNVYEFEKI